MTTIEVINEVDKLYFNKDFSFEFVSNTTLTQSVLSGNDLITREIQSFVNLTLLKEFANTYTAFELSDWTFPTKEGGRVTKFSFIDFNPTIKENKHREVELVCEIDFEYNRHIKDITDDCLKAATVFLEKKLKENERKVLSGDLT